MSTTVDPFLLTLTLIMVILLIVGNIYLVAHYAHHSDSAFGSSTAVKTVIVSDILSLNHSSRWSALYLLNVRCSCCP